MNTRTYLGNVAVDSGSLAILDPANARELLPKLEPELEYRELSFNNGQTAAAVVAHIPGGDGVYPVFLEQDENGRYHLRIELNLIPAESLAAALERELKRSKNRRN